MTVCFRYRSVNNIMEEESPNERNRLPTEEIIKRSEQLVVYFRICKPYAFERVAPLDRRELYDKSNAKCSHDSFTSPTMHGHHIIS